MPIFEYQCERCGEKKELLQTIHEPPLKWCDKCCTNGMKKIISNVGVEFKGHGWPTKDYKMRGK